MATFAVPRALGTAGRNASGSRTAVRRDSGSLMSKVGARGGRVSLRPAAVFLTGWLQSGVPDADRGRVRSAHRSERAHWTSRPRADQAESPSARRSRTTDTLATGRPDHPTASPTPGARAAPTPSAAP